MIRAIIIAVDVIIKFKFYCIYIYKKTCFVDKSSLYHFFFNILYLNLFSQIIFKINKFASNFFNIKYVPYIFIKYLNIVYKFVFNYES